MEQRDIFLKLLQSFNRNWLCAACSPMVYLGKL